MTEIRSKARRSAVLMTLIAGLFAAMSVLVAAAKALRSSSGQLVLVADDPRVTRVIEITGLGRVLRIESSLPEAVQRLVDGRDG